MRVFLFSLTISSIIFSNIASASTINTDNDSFPVQSLIDPGLQLILNPISDGTSKISIGYEYMSTMIMYKISVSCFNNIAERDNNATLWYNNIINRNGFVLIELEPGLPINSVEISNSIFSSAYIPIDNYADHFCGVAIYKRIKAMDNINPTEWKFSLKLNQLFWDIEVTHLNKIIGDKN